MSLSFTAALLFTRKLKYKACVSVSECFETIKMSSFVPYQYFLCSGKKTPMARFSVTMAMQEKKELMTDILN